MRKYGYLYCNKDDIGGKDCRFGLVCIYAGTTSNTAAVSSPPPPY
jgi:hypothetical protein